MNQTNRQRPILKCSQSSMSFLKRVFHTPLFILQWRKPCIYILLLVEFSNEFNVGMEANLLQGVDRLYDSSQWRSTQVPRIWVLLNLSQACAGLSQTWIQPGTGIARKSRAQCFLHPLWINGFATKAASWHRSAGFSIKGSACMMDSWQVTWSAMAFHCN